MKAVTVQFPAPAPQMFSSGPLPRFTSSGVDPEALWWVPWKLRHSAAYTPHRSRVLKMIEESEGLEDKLQSPDGRAALREYVERAREWALAAPPEEEPSDEQ